MSGILSTTRELGKRPAAESVHGFGSGRRAKDWRPEILPGNRALYMGQPTDWSYPVARARRVKRHLKRAASRESRRVSAAELQLRLVELDAADPAPAIPVLDLFRFPVPVPVAPQCHLSIPLDWIKNRRRQPVPEQAAS